MELPRQLTPFVGRRDDLAAIAALLQNPNCRLLTIAGPGGVGKTRLAIQAAAEMAHRYADGVAFVPLQALAAPQHLVAKLADALELSLSGQTSPEEQLVAHLRDKTLLLVLDNFEHLLDRAGLLSALLVDAPHLTILVTSREQLRLQEEWVYPVWGLKAPSPGDEEQADRYDAVRFFAERARQVNPHFSLEDERSAVIQICRLVEGVPLALELAASWARSLSCQAIAAEIQQNLDFLASGLRNIPERHRSIRAVFDQSWQYLTPEEQAVFKQLSVFRGTFRRQAAEEIAAATLPILSALVNKSLLQWDARGRYHLHELLRQYAEELLMASPEGTDVRDGHCAYFARFLRQRLVDIHAGRQVDALQEMEAELDNLRAAWHWAASQGRVEAIRNSLHAITWLWHYQSRYLEAANALQLAMQTLEAGEAAHQGDAGEHENREQKLALAEVANQYGWICVRLGRIEEAAEHWELAHQVHSELHVDSVSDSGSDPLTGLAMVALLTGDAARAIEVLETARKQQEARGDQRNLYTSYYVLTSALIAQGHYEAAEQAARQAHRFAQSLNDRWSMAYTLNDLGQIASLLGDDEQAQQHYRASYAIRRQYNDREGMAVALRQLGQIALHKREAGEAKRLLRESLRLYQGIGDLGGLAATLDGLGMAEALQGKYQEAGEHLLQALRIVTQLQLLPLILSVLTSTAELLLATGRGDEGMMTLALVAHHPSTPHDVKDRAARLLDSYAASLPPDHRAALVAQGRALDPLAHGSELLGLLAIVPVVAAPQEPDGNELTHVELSTNPNQQLVEPLTPREIDVLQCMAGGLTNQQIAEELIVALGTVKAYTNRIYGKLGVQNRVQAIEQARKLGIL